MDPVQLIADLEVELDQRGHFDLVEQARAELDQDECGYFAPDGDDYRAWCRSADGEAFAERLLELRATIADVEEEPEPRLPAGPRERLSDLADRCRHDAPLPHTFVL